MEEYCDNCHKKIKNKKSLTWIKTPEDLYFFCSDKCKKKFIDGLKQKDKPDLSYIG